MSTWYYSGNLGLFLTDKTVPANMIVTSNNLYPPLFTTSNALGIMTGQSMSNLPYTLNVNGDAIINSNLYVLNRIGVNTSNPTSDLHIIQPSQFNFAEFQSNAILITDNTSNGSQHLYMGADSSNRVSYISSTGSNTFRPLLLNPRGAPVCVNTLNSNARFNIQADTSYLNTEFQNNALLLHTSNNSQQFLYQGVDSTNQVSYIQSTGSNATQSLLLNPRGGRVGIGRLPAFTLDVNGTINATTYTGNTITDLTNSSTFGSNTGVWGSNTGVWGSNTGVWGSNTAVWASNAIANTSNNLANTTPIVSFDLNVNIINMTGSNVSRLSDGTYPSSGSNANQSMPVSCGGWYIQQLADDSYDFNNFTIGRLNLRGTLETFNSSPNFFTRLNIMYSSNINPFVWQPLQNTGGSNAIVRFFSRGYSGGYMTAQSQWFTYPSALINNLNVSVYLGLQIADTTSRTTGFRLGGAVMEVR